ncbi:hypothetical protein GWK47_035552 [Chionoecetes opilio]|uniref:Non-haem dioxygenase N-terminal domain-containing protein n=1 Tax=Chionoecetes opilio TaxID=41210 RepID=A0A8J4YGQ7_CHIOP|nr:hypothetical protein GWK47_035552 [Chionoecetes opilio]
MQSQESGCSKLPTLDLGELGVQHTGEPSQQEWQRVTRQLDRALSDVGCAYLTGHGVPDDQVKEAFSSAIAFFKAERDFKMRWVVPDEGNVGYIAMSSEKYSDEGKELHEGFLFKQGSYDHEKEAPPFMTAVTPLAQLVHALSRRLMTSLALSLS